MAIKVAVIGAGSIEFTRGIVRDLLSVPEFRDTEFAFTDISERNLEMGYTLCRRDVEAGEVPAKLAATMDRREAVQGADYVFSVVRVGGLEAFETDIEIPLRYGVDQCVGDTLGPGGIMYAQRSIPVILEFCRDTARLGSPDPLFLNYANPMAMNMWATCEADHGVRAVGLCHGVQHGHVQIAQAFGLPPEEVDVVCAGINHQTWYVSVRHKGEDLTGRLLEVFESNSELVSTEKVRIDMLRRFGYYSTETNGHLSEYLPWYRKRPDELKNWVDPVSWWGGETGGYLRACRENRNWFEAEYPRWLREEPPGFDAEYRSVEHGSYIVEALETGRVYRGHFNVRNEGCIANLPSDAIVEVPGYVDRNGMHIPRVGDLPMGCAAVCNINILPQRLAVHAALTGDDMLLRQAFMMDPLTGAVCDPPEIWQMVDEMLVAQRHWLPQYRQSVEDAERRLAGGNLVPSRRRSGTRPEANR